MQPLGTTDYMDITKAQLLRRFKKKAAAASGPIQRLPKRKVIRLLEALKRCKNETRRIWILRKLVYLRGGMGK